MRTRLTRVYGPNAPQPVLPGYQVVVTLPDAGLALVRPERGGDAAWRRLRQPVLDAAIEPARCPRCYALSTRVAAIGRCPNCQPSGG